MKMKSLLTGLALTLGLTGCTPPPAVVTATEKTPCGPLRLTEGQALQLSLPATPSTGYSWEVQQLPDMLRMDGAGQYLPSERQPGAGGAMHWAFTAERPGEGTLLLTYRRPWEKGAVPAQTFRCSVRVTE